VVGSVTSAAGRDHALLVTLEEDDRKKNKVARGCWAWSKLG
jgi:hypothetical protein